MAVRLSLWAPPLPLLAPDVVWPPPQHRERCANALVQWKNDWGEVVLWFNQAAQPVWWIREEGEPTLFSRRDRLGRRQWRQPMFTLEPEAEESY